MVAAVMSSWCDVWVQILSVAVSLGLKFVLVLFRLALLTFPVGSSALLGSLQPLPPPAVECFGGIVFHPAFVSLGVVSSESERGFSVRFLLYHQLALAFQSKSLTCLVPPPSHLHLYGATLLVSHGCREVCWRPFGESTSESIIQPWSLGSSKQNLSPLAELLGCVLVSSVLL